MVGFRNLQFLEGGNGFKVILFANGRTGFPMWPQSPCLSPFCLCWLLLCSAPSTGPGTKACSTFPGLSLAGGPAPAPGKVCRWKEVWREPVGAAGSAGSGPLMTSPWRGGAGTEASRQHAWFIKSHQELRLGTAVIYSYFSLVKCYWLFYTKGSLSWMGCTGIRFTSIFCQLCFPLPPLASEVIYGSERGRHLLSEGEKRADGFKEKPSIIEKNLWLVR